MMRLEIQKSKEKVCRMTLSPLPLEKEDEKEKKRHSSDLGTLSSANSYSNQIKSLDWDGPWTMEPLCLIHHVIMQPTPREVFGCEMVNGRMQININK